jgi:hypothetical protein
VVGRGLGTEANLDRTSIVVLYGTTLKNTRHFCLVLECNTYYDIIQRERCR